MKLNKKAVALLACTFACSSVFIGCGKDNNGDGDGDGDGSGGANTSGDGDGDGDGSGGSNTTGDGDGDNGPVGLQCSEPGGAQCTGTASGIVCPDGSTDGVPFTCAVGDVCEDGSCVGQCEAGATECVGGSVLRVCAANGREWVNIPCQLGQVCEDGACGDEGGLVCVPGAKDCDGNTARACRADGSGWDETACPGTTKCEDGACEGSVCTVGATKCDDTAQLSAAMFEGYTEPNLSVIHRCVDGEAWVVEACPSDEDTVSYCNYDGFSRSEAASYRQEVNSWFFANFVQGPPDFSTFPSSPAIPQGLNASCREVPDDYTCDEVFDVFFETPAMTRECVDLDDPEGSDIWTGYTECQGFPPYAPLQLVDNRCDGLTVCNAYEPDQGCVMSECIPGETVCGTDGDPSTTYGMCFYEGSGAYFSYYQSCPDSDGGGGAGPGACTDAGQAPNRQASCNGVEVDGELPPP